MFDFLEALHMIVSMPNYDSKKLKHISYSKDRGRKLLRDAINDDLALYTTPYKLLENGQIVKLEEGALSDLADEGLKLRGSGKVNTDSVDTVHQSIYLYLKRGSSLTEKKAAIKELASSLESLRPKVKDNLLSDDEKELFNIANNFAVRHQKLKLKPIWKNCLCPSNLIKRVKLLKRIKNQKIKLTRIQKRFTERSDAENVV